MLRNDDRLISIADGRMTFEHFRGRTGNIHIQHIDGSSEPFIWYDTSRKEASNENQGEYDFDFERYKNIIEEQFRGREKIQGAVLLSSWGGIVGSSLILDPLIDAIHQAHGSVSTYCTTVAASSGGDLLLQTDNIHLLEETHCMWHIASMPKNYREELKSRMTTEEIEIHLARLNRFRHKLHQGNMRLLIERTCEEYKEEVREHVYDAMMRHGMRHELSLTGTEMHRYGIAASASPNVDSLEKKFREDNGLETDAKSWVENPIHRFFLLSRIEEQIRHALNVSLKILLLKENLYTWQMSEAALKSVSHTVLAQADDIVKQKAPELRRFRKAT